MRLLFFFTLIIIIIISTVLPYFQEIENADIEVGDGVNVFETEDSNHVAQTPFLVPLYYKTPQNLFLNETRANIYEVITDNPGITFGAITRVLSLAPGECQYHIRVLERGGHIKSKRTGKYTRYYLVGQRASEVSKVQEQIILTIKENEGFSQTEIALELKISKQVVNYNIRFLVKNGYVLEVKENGRCSYQII
jgi:predicted transcriptional regulator